MSRRTDRDIRVEAEVARDLIRALASDDEALAHDMVEGETGLLEAIDAALAQIDDCEAMIAGCKAKEAEFAARRERAERHRESVRGLIEQALLVAGLSKVKRPTATLSVSAVAPKPIVTDEAAVPAEFWRQPDPVLDKTKLNAAAKDATAIPGVTMSNGGTRLTIRRA